MPTKVNQKKKTNNKNKTKKDEVVGANESLNNDLSTINNPVLDCSEPPLKKQKPTTDEVYIKQENVPTYSKNFKLDTSKLVFLNQKNASSTNANSIGYSYILEPNAMFVLLKRVIQILHSVVELEHKHDINESVNSENLAFLQTEMDEERFKSGILNKKVIQLLLQHDITDPKNVISLNCKFMKFFP
jgi:hypothetical protein